jgi:hypothetical protein
MFMKNDSGRASAFVAQVEVSSVRFDKGVDLGIEFKNQIDGWKKMEFKFRQQITQLRTGKAGPRHSWSDLSPLNYAIREKID